MKIIRCICGICLLVLTARSLILMPSLPLIGRGNRLNRVSSLAMKYGGHNENFKFLPMIRFDSLISFYTEYAYLSTYFIISGTEDEHFPRIIHIAGVFPNLTPEQLLAPISSPAAPAGSWTYEFADPDGPQLGTVALPGSKVYFIVQQYTIEFYLHPFKRLSPNAWILW